MPKGLFNTLIYLLKNQYDDIFNKLTSSFTLINDEDYTVFMLFLRDSVKTDHPELLEHLEKIVDYSKICFDILKGKEKLK